MRRWTACLLAVVALAAAATAGDARAKTPATRPTGSSIVSTAKQVDLKLRTMRFANGATLADALRHNRQAWESLSSDEREAYRRKALAFLQKDPREQQKLLEHYEKLIQLSAQKRQEYRARARWLKTVVESFTPEEREAMRKAPPSERARLLLDRKAKLAHPGRLSSGTASGPAPQPSGR